MNDGHKQDYHNPFICNGYEYEAMEVTNCLLNGKIESDIMPLDLSIQLIEILDSVRVQNNIVY